MKIKKFLQSIKWVAFWVGMAMLMDLGIWFFLGQQKALEFLGGYLIELSLSIDNLFVFISIFTAFGIVEHAQHRVLKWGIAGAVVLRLIFILLGVALVNQFVWVLYLFGAFLIYNGIKMFLDKGEKKNVAQSPLIRQICKFLPMTETLVGEKFFVKEKSRRNGGKMILHATPLFGVMIFIVFSDIIFAVDSVPVILSISRDVFIVYTSNIFAILGLWQFYFFLEHLQERFCYVRYGVALILAFAGVKLVLLYFSLHISILVSIIVIFSILFLSILFSVFYTKRQEGKALQGE